MPSGFSMQAMTRSVPPHLGQVSMSMAKTRFQALHRCHGARGLSGFSWRGLRFGTTHSRCLQFGANTPWNRVRFNRGRGTKAARRAMTIRQDCRFGRPQVARRVAHMHVRHQLEWLEDDVGGAVAKRLLETDRRLVPAHWSRAARWRWRAVRWCDRAFRACRVGRLHRRWRRGAKSPGSLASKVDGKGSDCTGTVRKVNAFLPALGPMAIR